jgi:hypothetical protein
VAKTMGALVHKGFLDISYTNSTWKVHDQVVLKVRVVNAAIKK